MASAENEPLRAEQRLLAHGALASGVFVQQDE
jgi:hypothetical protein